MHASSVEELRARFGSFQVSDRRPSLMQNLEAFLGEARSSGMFRVVIVNGSFVTGKPDPNDIDLLLVVPSGHNFDADLTPTQYRVVDSRRVR
jgi:hypothetical protein